jgi:hypothetical protein
MSPKWVSVDLDGARLFTMVRSADNREGPARVDWPTRITRGEHTIDESFAVRAPEIHPLRGTAEPLIGNGRARVPYDSAGAFYAHAIRYAADPFDRIVDTSLP